MALQEEKKRGDERRHDKAGCYSKTAGEWDGAIMELPVPGVVHQSNAQAELLLQRHVAKCEGERTQDSEQIDVEGEHGFSGKLHELHRLHGYMG